MIDFLNPYFLYGMMTAITWIYFRAVGEVLKDEYLTKTYVPIVFAIFWWIVWPASMILMTYDFFSQKLKIRE